VVEGGVPRASTAWHFLKDGPGAILAAHDLLQDTRRGVRHDFPFTTAFAVRGRRKPDGYPRHDLTNVWIWGACFRHKSEAPGSARSPYGYHGAGTSRNHKRVLPVSAMQSLEGGREVRKLWGRLRSWTMRREPTRQPVRGCAISHAPGGLRCLDFGIAEDAAAT